MAVKETARSAQSQLASMPERVAVVETKVDSMIVCIESIKESQKDIRSDVKDMHDCLDNTRDILADKLEKMQDEYRANSSKFFEHADKLHAEDQASHNALDKKIKDLEQFKTKWIYMTAGAIAALGFVSGHATTLLALFK
jgi:tetrahydromethanopterin S-methyltransferase subunit B